MKTDKTNQGKYYDYSRKPFEHNVSGALTMRGGRGRKNSVSQNCACGKPFGLLFDNFHYLFSMSIICVAILGTTETPNIWWQPATDAIPRFQAKQQKKHHHKWILSKYIGVVSTHFSVFHLTKGCIQYSSHSSALQMRMYTIKCLHRQAFLREVWSTTSKYQRNRNVDSIQKTYQNHIHHPVNRQKSDTQQSGKKTYHSSKTHHDMFF